MILFLSELQKQHLSFLHGQSAQVLVDFCKLVLDYLNNGYNNNKNSLAAEKFDIPVSCVQDLINALAYLIIEGCKHNLSESNFKSSLALAGFVSEQQQILVKLYNSKKSEISSALYQLQNKDPSYQDFTWRFEIQRPKHQKLPAPLNLNKFNSINHCYILSKLPPIDAEVYHVQYHLTGRCKKLYKMLASQNCLEEIKPMVTLNFVVTTPKRFGQNELDSPEFQNKNDYRSSINVNSSVQDAKAASQCQNIIHHILLQCDLPNLLHLTSRLEEAIKESKSQHVRKVQRSL